MYLDGELQTDTATGPTGSVDGTNTLYIGSLSGVSNFLSGTLSNWVAIFNRLLSAAEARALSSSPLTQLDWADYGGSNVDITSGTVVKGIKYRTETYVAGDDFSNIADTGASANVTGAEWTATGMTPTTWTNSSVLHRLGAIAIYLAEDTDIDPDTGEAITLRDSSGNANHGACTDVERFGGAVREQEQWITFTPTLVCGASGTITLDTSYDTLVCEKRGRKVSISGFIQTSGVSSPLGDLTLEGLPYTCTDLVDWAERSMLSITMYGLGSAPSGVVVAHTIAGESVIHIRDNGNSTGALNVDFADHIDSSTAMYISGFYYTDD